MTDNTNTTTPATLTKLTGALEQSLITPSADKLNDQTAILHEIFTKILEGHVIENIGNPHRALSTQSWLALALRVQKQCTDTAKAQSAIDYMRHLNKTSSLPPFKGGGQEGGNKRPHPIPIEEQTEGS